MDNNIAVNRYLKDEYISIIDADHELSQRERKNIGSELISLLKLTSCHDNVADKIRRYFWQLWHKDSRDNSVVQPQIHQIPRPLPRT